jgi:hypothetical protein
MKHYFTALETPTVDSKNGIIRGVSLISLGDAKGHFDDKGRQVIVDETTLEQIFNHCKKLGTVKVKADHGSGVFEIVGWADNFAMTANKVLADVHLYESEPNRPRLLEIAEKNPTHMGISMEFTGADKARGTVCLSRCDEVIAAAIVDDPAANSSLFSAIPPETETKENMETETIPETPDKYEELSKRFEDLTNKFEEFSKKFETPEDDTDEPKLPVVVATDAGDEPAPSDPKKVYANPDADIDDEATKRAEMAAERVFKKFAASLGITNLGKPGTSGAPASKVKSFSEMVDDETKNFGGDRVKAEAHLLSKIGKDEAVKKAYSAHRLVKSA